MITLRTITTIELSNACSLACPYCVNRLMHKHGREYGIMDEATFDRSLYWLQMLCDLGTQAEVNLNGNGESLLDPDLPARIRRVKDIMGDRRVCMCTNGTHMTYEMACKIRDAGIDQCDLSPPLALPCSSGGHRHDEGAAHRDHQHGVHRHVP